MLALLVLLLVRMPLGTIAVGTSTGMGARLDEAGRVRWFALVVGVAVGSPHPESPVRLYLSFGG